MPQRVKIVLIVLGLLLSNQGRVAAQDQVNGLEAGVKEYFVTEKIISFPADLIIGEITFIDVAENGDMVVVDGAGLEAWIFTGEGELISSLDPSECHPGFEMRPTEAHFVGPDHVFLKNVTPPGYLFLRDGSCGGSMSDAFSSPRDVSGSEDGYLYGLYDYHQGNNDWVIKKMTKQGEEVDVFEVSEPSRFPNVARRFVGGGFDVSNTEIFYMSVASPFLQLFDLKTGRMLGGKNVDINGYVPLVKDLPSSASDPSFLSSIQENRGASKIMSLFFVADELLLVGFTNQNGYNYLFIDPEGNNVIQSYSESGHYFFAVQNGLFYRVKQPGLNSIGELPNPFVEVLKLKENAINQ